MTVLVVDDEPEVRQVLSVVLKRAAYGLVDAVGNGIDVIRRIMGTTYDLVVLDLALPDIGGDDILLLVRGRMPHSVVAIVSGDPQGVSEAQRRSAGLVMAKPFEADTILALGRLSRELAEKRAEITALGNA